MLMREIFTVVFVFLNIRGLSPPEGALGVATVALPDVERIACSEGEDTDSVGTLVVGDVGETGRGERIFEIDVEVAVVAHGVSAEKSNDNGKLLTVVGVLPLH